MTSFLDGQNIHFYTFVRILDVKSIVLSIIFSYFSISPNEQFLLVIYVNASLNRAHPSPNLSQAR